MPWLWNAQPWIPANVISKSRQARLETSSLDRHTMSTRRSKKQEFENCRGAYSTRRSYPRGGNDSQRLPVSTCQRKIRISQNPLIWIRNSQGNCDRQVGLNINTFGESPEHRSVIQESNDGKGVLFELKGCVPR